MQRHRSKKEHASYGGRVKLVEQMNRERLRNKARNQEAENVVESCITCYRIKFIRESL